MKCTEHDKNVCIKTHTYSNGSIWCAYHQLDVYHNVYGIPYSKEVKDADTEYENKD